MTARTAPHVQVVLPGPVRVKMQPLGMGHSEQKDGFPKEVRHTGPQDQPVSGWATGEEGRNSCVMFGPGAQPAMLSYRGLPDKVQAPSDIGMTDRQTCFSISVSQTSPACSFAKSGDLILGRSVNILEVSAIETE